MTSGWLMTEGTVASVAVHQNRNSEWFTVVFTYKVDGGWYGGTFTSFTSYDVGEILDVEYDPQRPEINNFTRRERLLHWFYVAFFLALGVLALYLFLQPKTR